MASPDKIIGYIADRVSLITGARRTTRAGAGKFLQSSYRFALDDEPDAAIDGKFYVAFERQIPRERKFGAQTNYNDATFIVEVGYFRGGGDLRSSTKRTVPEDAIVDCNRIADHVESPAAFDPPYDRANTGIREIRFKGIEARSKPQADIYQVLFWVQWQQAYDNATVTHGTTEAGMLEQIDRFTATDGQTVFLLSQIPADAADVTMVVAGVGQTKDVDYTVVNQTLTWIANTPMKAGWRVEIEYMYEG